MDRSNRKLVIILTDLAAGFVTLAWLVILATSGDLESVSYTHLDVYKRQPSPSPSRREGRKKGCAASS